MCACSRLLCSLHARFIVSYNFMNERGGGRRSAVQRFSIIDIRLPLWWWRRLKSSCRVASTHPEVENGMTRPYGGKSASSLNSSPSTTRVKVFHLFVVGVSQRCAEIMKNCAFYISFFSFYLSFVNQTFLLIFVVNSFVSGSFNLIGHSLPSFYKYQSRWK